MATFNRYFSASDPLAIGAMRALYENGYKIPDDISIIGFDDISVASFFKPSADNDSYTG